MSRPFSVVAVSVDACSEVVVSPLRLITGATLSMLLKVMLFVPVLPAASVALKYHVPFFVTSRASVYFVQLWLSVE